MHFISELCENGTVKVSPEPSKYTAVMKYRYVHIVLCSLPTSVHIFKCFKLPSNLENSLFEYFLLKSRVYLLEQIVYKVLLEY